MSRLHREELLRLTLEQATGRDAGPRGDHLGDVVGADPLLDHEVGGGDGRLGLLGLLELLLEAGDLAVQEPGGTLVVALALEPVGLGAQVVEARLEVADPVEPGLLGLPARGEGRELLGLLGEVGAQLLEPLDRRLVLLLGEVQLLHAEPVDRPAQDVDLHRAGVDLHAEPGRRLVDEVDGLVGQLATGDVAVGQAGGGHQCGVLDLDLVVRLVALLEPAEDGDRVLDARLADEDLLEPALQRWVLLDVLTELVEGRRPHEAQLAPGQHRLEHVAGVHGGLTGRAGAHDGVQLVDEGDDLPVGALDLLEHGLEALLELAPVLGAGDHRRQVEAEEPLAPEGLRDVAVDDPLGQALHHRRLADAGVADEHRVVLRATAQHLHDAADLTVPADDRVELAVPRGLGEVRPVLLERLARGIRVLAGDLGTAAQVLELGLERGGVALDGLLLQEGEEQDVGGQVGVAPGRHEGGGVLQHREGGLAEARRGDGRTAAAGHAGQDPSGGRRHPFGRGARGGQQGRRRRALLLGERQGEVGGGDLGVPGALGRALGDGERLGDLRRGLQLHGELLGRRGTCPRVQPDQS